MKRVPAICIDRERDGIVDVAVGIRHAFLVRPIVDYPVAWIVLLDWNVTNGHPEAKNHEIEKPERQEQGGESDQR